MAHLTPPLAPATPQVFRAQPNMADSTDDEVRPAPPPPDTAHRTAPLRLDPLSTVIFLGAFYWTNVEWVRVTRQYWRLSALSAKGGERRVGNRGHVRCIRVASPACAARCALAAGERRGGQLQFFHGRLDEVFYWTIG